MAHKRMFSLSVVDTDKFLEMSACTQLLYFHLGMRADDDGFVASPKRILRTVGCAEDDLKLLIAKGYIIPFETGVCVITDWHQNNYLRKDRYTPTIYLAEKSELSMLLNGSYSLGIPDDNQAVDILATQKRREEKRIIYRRKSAQSLIPFGRLILGR